MSCSRFLFKTGCILKPLAVTIDEAASGRGRRSLFVCRLRETTTAATFADPELQ
jgi:hypothetical protein